jgi:hypothetical protein
VYRIITSGTRRHCQGVSRRELLQVGSVGFVGLSLADLMAARAAAGAGAAPDKGINCIFLFLWGGPPQHELWDPKPDAPADVAGPVKPMETSVPGVRIGELLPRMAGLAHRYVIVRSAHHDNDVHGHGAHFAQTGMPKLPSVEHPNLGAVVDRFAGSRGALPGFVTVGPRMRDAPVIPTGQDGGFLGSTYQPFRILDPLAPLERQPTLSPPPGVSVDRLLRRDAVLREIDGFQRRVEDTDSVRGFGAAYRRAFALTTSPQAKAAFDLEAEPAGVRDRYGRHMFGQGCLLARRLIEGGVRYVQVNWADHPIENFGFDNHSDNHNRLKDHQLPPLDQACSALIEDLEQRGLYEQTLLVITGEFGRTPRINPSAGRDHWPQVYSFVIGGAGIPGGRVIGASDAHGAYPDSMPVRPEMVAASVFDLMGLDTTGALREAGVLSDSRGIPQLFGES